MKKFEYTITAPYGMHARPAGLLVKFASHFQSSIVVECNGKSADCKKIFAIMGLAIKQNDNIVITINGKDEQQAALEVEEFVKEHF